MIDFETKLDIRNALAALDPRSRAIAQKVMHDGVESLESSEGAHWILNIRPVLANSLDGVL